MAPVAVTGVPKHGSGPAPPRLEIRDFVQNIKHFSLYCQALRTLQEPGSANQLFSFNKIAGIHGKPATAWNESPSPSLYGYCVHGTYNFPTWHRPYMAALEQAINQIAVQLAGTYPVAERSAWQTAAADLRQPFWDWAKNSVPPDEIISLEQVHIISPTGPQNIPNPFLYFLVPDASRTTFDQPFSSWPKTLRHPNSDAPDAHSNVDDLRQVLAASQAQIATDVTMMYTLTTWPAFSNHSAGTGGGATSLEGIHDRMHVRIGGNSGGHMADPSVAGKSLTLCVHIYLLTPFDPIFYLHHAQVDRLLALWSVRHPNVWVPAGSNQDLRPFWANPPSSFWKPNDITTTANTLNYTYPDPELNGQAASSHAAPPTGYAAKSASGAPQSHHDILSPLHTLFVDHATQITRSEALGHAQAHLAAAADHIGDQVAAVLPNWTAHVTCKQYAYGSSFSVYFFLGEVPQDLKHWYKSPHFVGSFDAFVNGDPESCQNCQDQSELDVEGFVHLNLSLAGKGLASLLPDIVVPYLTKNLHWGILSKTGQVNDLESLKVRVMLYPLSKPPGALFPLAGRATYYDAITAGRRSLGV